MKMESTLSLRSTCPLHNLCDRGPSQNALSHVIHLTVLTFAEILMLRVGSRALEIRFDVAEESGKRVRA